MQFIVEVSVGSQKPLLDRLSDHSTDVLTLISNLIKFFKNSLSLLYFLLTLYSTFAQLSSIVEQMCLLKILLYSTLRISVFTHTLGKIHFLLCFACLRFLWLELVDLSVKLVNYLVELCHF